jgi:hypothetical protein
VVWVWVGDLRAEVAKAIAVAKRGNQREISAFQNVFKRRQAIWVRKRGGGNKVNKNSNYKLTKLYF